VSETGQTGETEIAPMRVDADGAQHPGVFVEWPNGARVPIVRARVSLIDGRAVVTLIGAVPTGMTTDPVAVEISVG
jgi:hypothetical protein